jgi:hypothetical protein
MASIPNLIVGQTAAGPGLNLLGIGVFLLTSLVAGCAKHVPPVSDVEQATDLIKQTFDDWQAGASLDAQRDKQPPVYVAEELWLNGTQLKEYELNGPGEVFGTNIRFQVTLKFAGSRSAASNDRQLKYLVTTTPACTIAREDR